MIWIFVLLAAVAVPAAGLLAARFGDRRRIDRRLRRYAASRDRRGMG